MAQQRTPSQRTASPQRPPQTGGSTSTKSSGAANDKPVGATAEKASGAADKPAARVEKAAGSGDRPPAAAGGRSSGTAAANLKELLDDLGSASEQARLQLHLLAVEARQRTGELSSRLEAVERGLDRGLHQALSTAAERARQLSKALQGSFGGGSAAQKSAQMRVGAVMTDEVQVCSPDDVLHRPAQIMWEGDCGSVPVVDPSGRVCGIITDRDVCMAAYTKGQPLNAIRVGDVMARHVHGCAPDDTLERAIGIMAEAEVRRLPVIAEDGKLRGIVALADIAHGAALLGQHEAEAIVFRLLRALSKPRSNGRRPQLAAE